MASQLAQNIAEAFLWRRPSDWIRLWYELALIERLREFLRHNNQRLTPSHRTGQRLRTDRTSYSVALGGLQTLVRNGKLYGRAHPMSSGQRVTPILVRQPFDKENNSGNRAADNY